MNYCLNSKELEYLLLFYLEKKDIENEDLKLLIDNAVQWHDKVLCLTFSFARILERQRDSILLNKKMIQTLFSISDKMFMDIQECGEKFIDYILRNEYSNESDLELSLMTAAKRLSENYYDKNTLRN